ncbi:MAG: anthranilate phosphoribosyltransferase [Pseudomonadota bacterium]|nr:anthranilate phosphoribosyltransferase [Pseudomonadota bacterium]
MSTVSIINKLENKTDLDRNEIKEFMTSVFNGDVQEDELTNVLILLNNKGITSDELTGCAQSMRQVSKKVSTKYQTIDNCGTGGDGIGTFNISTASSFIAASCGVHIAKHGNKAITSSSGSADLLMEAGANIDLLPEQISKCIDKINFGFMFAPLHHQAMKHVVGSRKKIAPKKTIFNLLGPLTNPAESKIQLIGVYSKEKIELVAESLKNLGTNRAMIVHSEDGLDEISIFSKTHVAEIKDSNINYYTIDPNDYFSNEGSLQDLIVKETRDSLSMVCSVFDNKEGPALNICLINAAALLYLSGKESTLKQAIKVCKESIIKGKVKQKFLDYIEFTKHL